MDKIKQKCLETTMHIANRIVLLRRTNKLTQEAFAEKVGLDRRTIARAEDGKHRPSAETMEMIAQAFCLSISFFFDDSIYRPDISKNALIYKINTKLTTMSKKDLNKIISIIDIL